MTGKKFKQLTVIKRDSDRVTRMGKREIMWLCKCDCGNIVSVRGASLRSGNTASCGCYKAKKSSERMSQLSYSHGLSKTRIYKTWKSMIERCERKNNKSYKNYGAVGVTVCDEWHSLDTFVKWAYDTGYTDELTIERLDNTLGYNPENCI